MRVLFHSTTYLGLCFIRATVLAPSRVSFSTTAAYLFSVFVCALILPCILKSIALRVGVKTLHNAMMDVEAWNYNENKLSNL